MSTSEIAVILVRHPAAVCKQYATLKKLSPMTLPPSIQKRLGSVRKIFFAMKNRLRKYVLKKTLQKCTGAEKGGT